MRWILLQVALGKKYLLIIGDSAHDSCIYHSVQEHTQRVDVERLVSLILTSHRLDVTVLRVHCLHGDVQGVQLKLRGEREREGIKIINCHYTQ